MFYRPAEGSMWDPSVIWHAGKYYLFSMYGKGPIRLENNPPFESTWMATSSDGVHWDDFGPVIRDDEASVFKMFVARCGDRFIMNHGSFTGFGTDEEQQNRLRFFESNDLVHWNHLFDSYPDPRWYSQRRWDHMYMIPKVEGAPEKGYWGYVVAHPRDDYPYRSCGMMQSEDGLRWEVIQPPVVEWGETPQRCLTVGGCERIGDRYYLIGGKVGYIGDYGWSNYTLVGDSPTGPFRPDLPAFRLCGASGFAGTWGVQFLVSFCRCAGELLISNYAYRWPDRQEGIWFTPLKKAVVDQAGHLRMGYWLGNEAVKGPSVAVDLERAVQAHPLVAESSSASAAALTCSASRALLEADKIPGGPHDDRHVVALLADQFDLSKGVVLEGALEADPHAGPHQMRWRPTYAGFYIEGQPGTGTAILLQVGHPAWRKSHVGQLTYASGAVAFVSLDETGPGCATVTGIEGGKTCTFRLLIRKNMFELYVNDLLFQTFVTGETSGRVGFIAQNGRVQVADVKAWEMNLN